MTLNDPYHQFQGHAIIWRWIPHKRYDIHSFNEILKGKGVFIATQLNSTQLNSADPDEQRTAKSVVFVYDVTTYKLSQLGHYVHW